MLPKGHERGSGFFALLCKKFYPRGGQNSTPLAACRLMESNTLTTIPTYKYVLDLRGTIHFRDMLYDRFFSWSFARQMHPLFDT